MQTTAVKERRSGRKRNSRVIWAPASSKEEKRGEELRRVWGARSTDRLDGLRGILNWRGELWVFDWRQSGARPFRENSQVMGGTARSAKQNNSRDTEGRGYWPCSTFAIRKIPRFPMVTSTVRCTEKRSTRELTSQFAAPSQPPTTHIFFPVAAPVRFMWESSGTRPNTSSSSYRCTWGSPISAEWGQCSCRSGSWRTRRDLWKEFRFWKGCISLFGRRTDPKLFFWASQVLLSDYSFSNVLKSYKSLEKLLE